LVCALILLAIVSSVQAAPPRLQQVEPAAVGLDARHLAAIDDVVAAALAAKQMPGCVVLIGRQGKIAFLKAYGSKQLQPEPAAMTTDTVFDLASITKPVATATSILLLIEHGKLRLEDPIAQHLPEFGQHGKDRITIQHLLTHVGGLIADNRMQDYADGPQAALERICELKPSAEPGAKFVYSDVGFIVLGEVVRRVSGKSVHEFSQAELFGPLGMLETGYLPADALRRRAAPTEMREDRWMQGEVHDPRAYKLGGIAGHAGLFSTAEDLAVFAQMLLNRGAYAGVRVLQPETIDLMTGAREVPGGLRALGWDVRTRYSSNRGENFSPRAFGHGGFTGTTLWIDPELDLCVLFLSNRVHPKGKGLVNPLAGKIGTIAAEAVRKVAPD
jgi:CubicO group peptidase (beta-lactamase class C family)